jgi:hypothetical protein
LNGAIIILEALPVVATLSCQATKKKCRNGLDDHIEMANNRLVNFTNSTTNIVPHEMPKTIDTRKRLYMNSNHSQEARIAKKKQDTFLTTDKLAKGTNSRDTNNRGL